MQSVLQLTIGPENIKKYMRKNLEKNFITTYGKKQNFTALKIQQT